ncbi:MAG: hypothetical protein AB7P04_09625 [Bacteriovoracia bacterium]
MKPGFIGKTAKLTAALGLLTLGSAVGAFANDSYRRVRLAGDTKQALERCVEGVEAGMATDVVACPVVKRYEVKNLKRALKVLLADEGVSDAVLLPSHFALAKLIDSINAQQAQVEESCEGHMEPAREALVNVKKELRQLVSLNARAGGYALFEADTYWAPSVNARALVLVNPKDLTVTIVMHGDTDG